MRHRTSRLLENLKSKPKKVYKVTLAERPIDIEVISHTQPKKGQRVTGYEIWLNGTTDKDSPKQSGTVGWVHLERRSYYKDYEAINEQEGFKRVFTKRKYMSDYEVRFEWIDEDKKRECESAEMGRYTISLLSIEKYVPVNDVPEMLKSLVDDGFTIIEKENYQKDWELIDIS